METSTRDIAGLECNTIAFQQRAGAYWRPADGSPVRTALTSRALRARDAALTSFAAPPLGAHSAPSGQGRFTGWARPSPRSAGPSGPPVSAALGTTKNMRHNFIAAIIILTTLGTFAEEPRYVVDVVYPKSEITLTLPLDDNGYAKRDYDGFLSFPSSFEADPSLIPTEWDKRGLGIFAEISVTNSGNAFTVAASLEEAALMDWNTTNIYGHIIRLPIFSSINLDTTITVNPDQWIDFGGNAESNEIAGMKLRLRKSIPNHGLESTGAPPPAKAPETHP